MSGSQFATVSQAEEVERLIQNLSKAMEQTMMVQGILLMPPSHCVFHHMLDAYMATASLGNSLQFLLLHSSKAEWCKLAVIAMVAPVLELHPVEPQSVEESREGIYDHEHTQ